MTDLHQQLRQYANNKVTEKTKIQITVSGKLNDALIRFMNDRGHLDKQDTVRYILTQILRKEGYMQ